MLGGQDPPGDSVQNGTLDDVSAGIADALALLRLLVSQLAAVVSRFGAGYLEPAPVRQPESPRRLGVAGQRTATIGAVSDAGQEVGRVGAARVGRAVGLGRVPFVKA